MSSCVYNLERLRLEAIEKARLRKRDVSRFSVDCEDATKRLKAIGGTVL